jgi:hypothetical protein
MFFELQAVVQVQVVRILVAVAELADFVIQHLNL